MNYIFDFDGTLMDTAPVILATMRASFAALGLPLIKEETCRASIGLRLQDVPAFLFPDHADMGTKFAETYHKLFEVYNKPGVVQPFPGVVTTLRRIYDSGSRLAVASSRNKESLMEFLEGMGVAALFDMVVAGDDVRHGKPDPEPVLVILDSLGWNAADTLVVGDAGVDIMMGHSAGCRTCAVTYGNGSLMSLKAASPDYIVDAFPRILDI